MTMLLIVSGVIPALLDLFSTGGATTILAPSLAQSASAGVGMMHGTAFMLRSSIGWAILLVLLAMLGVMV